MAPFTNFRRCVTIRSRKIIKLPQWARGWTLRKFCKNCQGKLDQKIFTQFNVGYTLCKKCNHLNAIYSDNKKFTNWVRIVNDFLQDIDWLGDRIHNSLQDKVFKSWSSVCDSLCSLDALGIGEISFHDFSYHLSRKLETIEMRYAEESSNLFILGPEQVSSVKPTHLWLIGANSGRPRIKTKISNLLPMDPQIKAMVPGIDPAVDFQLRQKLFDSFLNNKAEVIVSYSEYTKGIKNLKSPFLDRDPLIYKSCEKVKNQKTLVRPIDYENLRGAQLNHAGNSYGSVSFFADQAACPFRGYAIHRLGSKTMHEPSPGISKKLQGILVHEVLASLWGNIKSLENLRSKKILAAAVDVIKNESEDISKNKLVKYAIKNNNLIITPHIAGLTFDSEYKAAKQTILTLNNFFK